MELGVGVVYSPEIEPLFTERGSPVQVVEIHPQPSWVEGGGASGRSMTFNAAVMARVSGLPQARLVHGIGAPVGSTVQPDVRHKALYLTAVSRLGACWASEHLGFDRAHGPAGLFGTGCLLPPRQTIDGVVASAVRIRELASGLAVPFAFESCVNYLKPRPDEMTDGAFVSAVATVADCGILLDLPTLRANERHGRQSIEEFLAEIPLERVLELHLGGDAAAEGAGSDGDAGDGSDVDLARRVVPMLPNLGAIILEPEAGRIAEAGLGGIRRRVERLHALWALRRPLPEAFRACAPDAIVVRGRRTPCGPSPQEWERTLGALVAGLPADAPLAAELAADAGLDFLRNMAAEARARRLSETLELTTRLLGLTRGEPFLRDLLVQFLRACPPRLYAATEAFEFARWLETRHGFDVPLLREVLRFEIALERVAIAGGTVLVNFRHDPGVVLGALAEGRMPDAPGKGEFLMEVAGDPAGDGLFRLAVVEGRWRTTEPLPRRPGWPYLGRRPVLSCVPAGSDSSTAVARSSGRTRPPASRRDRC